MADVIAWLDTDAGQEWLNDSHTHVLWTGECMFASVKEDPTDPDIFDSGWWRWAPGMPTAYTPLAQDLGPVSDAELSRSHP